MIKRLTPSQVFCAIAIVLFITVVLAPMVVVDRMVDGIKKKKSNRPKTVISTFDKSPLGNVFHPIKWESKEQILKDYPRRSDEGATVQKRFHMDGLKAVHIESDRIQPQIGDFRVKPLDMRGCSGDDMADWENHPKYQKWNGECWVDFD